MLNTRRVFGPLPGPVPLSYLDDNFTALAQTFVSSIAELRNLPKTGSGVAVALGYYTAGDGPGGVYVLLLSDTSSSDNGGTIIVAADGGRWHLLNNGWVDVRLFGVIIDWNLTSQVGTDNSAALQAAVNAAVSSRFNLLFPPTPSNLAIGFATTQVWGNNIIYQGAGTNANGAGTVLYYTGISDAIQVNNPSNSFTAANIQVRDMLIASRFQTANKATFVDNGSSYLHFVNVGFNDNGYAVILDQSELVVFERCNFTCHAGVAAGVWCVDGADRTVGNLAGYTNTIAFHDCNFGGGVTGTSSGLAIDGGINYTVEGCQFTGFAKQIRVANVRGLVVENGEYEGMLANGVFFAATKLKGGAAPATLTADIRGGFYLCTAMPAANFAIDADVNGITFLEVRNATFQTSPTGGMSIGINNISTLTASGNLAKDNASASLVTYSNFGSLGYSTNAWVAYNTNNVSLLAGTAPLYAPAWTGTITNPALGNGTLVGSYVRHGPILLVSIALTIGSTTTFGSGNWQFSLPFPEFIGVAWEGAVKIVHGASIYRGVCELLAGGALVTLYAGDGASSVVTPTFPVTFATGDTIAVTLTYGQRAK